MSALKKQVGGNHYKNLPIQPVEFCQKNQLNYCESAAIKYICRHRNKNGENDIKKAIHYLELLLELEYGKPTNPMTNKTDKELADDCMNIYTFHRKDGFYPLELRDDADAIENAKRNHGTLKVVNEITGKAVWPDNRTAEREG